MHVTPFQLTYSRPPAVPPLPPNYTEVMSLSALQQQQEQCSEDPVFQSHDILQPFTQVAVICQLKLYT